MDIKSYKKKLQINGNNLAQVRKNNAYDIMNHTFTDDPEYKRVYILTTDGWKFEDAKYQTHAKYSISGDQVDRYLQFRPTVHYPIGSYVLIPDDTTYDIDLSEEELENPFKQNPENRKMWWIIVGRDDANSFVRYNVLKCNWNFQWIYEGKINSCYACVRNANSYTSGKWSDAYSSTVDDLMNAWIPDVYHVYKDKLSEFGLDDTRTILYEQRFMLTNNIIEPRVYQTTKLVDLAPQGIIKLSLKQDEYNRKLDNLELKICNYYDNNGESLVVRTENNNPDINKTSIISWMKINSDYELEAYEKEDNKITIGEDYYLCVEFSNDTQVSPNWKIEYLDDLNESDYYEGLINIEEVNSNTIKIKARKAYSLVGKHFEISVGNTDNEYCSSIEVEVTGIE